MAGRGSKSTQRARTEAERARLYAARSDWHERQGRRRVRDNAVAGIAGGLLLAAAIASQVVHAQVTAPEPVPSVSPSTTPAPSSTPTPDITATPTPTVSPAP